MTVTRQLSWEGCNNVRDLGGMTTTSGYKNRWGAVVRSDHPAKLTAAGWSALYAHGIRTIISLRTHGLDETFSETAPRPADLDAAHAVTVIGDLGQMIFIERRVEGRPAGSGIEFVL